MRVPTDMPKRRRSSGRGRIIVIVVIAVAFLLITSLRGLAGFWTDYLWFDSLGLSSVFSGVLGARIALGVIFTGVFFVLTFVSLTVADRIAPKNRPLGPEDDLLNRYHAVVDRRATLFRAVVSIVLGLIAGVGMSGEWNQWILFRNGGSFGIKDQTFQTDVGFYVFKLPFYMTVVNWLFASGIIILLVTIVAHYLNGGIRLQSPIQRVTPQVKAHISVILGLLALVKAVDYWLQRYALTWSTRGTVDGATYTDVKAQLPAIYLLLFIALLSFGLFIYNIWRRGWVLPVVAVGLWALVSVRRRGRLPGLHPAVPGGARGVLEGAALHPAQHRGDPAGAGARPDPDRAVQVHAGPGPDDPGHRRQPRHDPQHPAARPVDRDADLPEPAEPVRLLPVQRARRRPLPDRRDQPRRHERHAPGGQHPGGARRPRPLHQRHPTAVLGGQPPRLHPRLRPGPGTGQHHQPGRPAQLPGQGRPRRRRQRSAQPEDRPAPAVLRREPAGVRRHQHRPRRGRLHGRRRGRGPEPLHRLRRGEARLLRPQGGVRPALRRLEPDRLELPHQRLAHRVRAGHPEPHREGRPVHAVGRRPVPGRAERPDRLHLGRLHQHRPLPQRRAGRQRRSDGRERPRAAVASTTCATR